MTLPLPPAKLATELAYCSEHVTKAARTAFRRGALARLRGAPRQAPADVEIDELDPWHDGWDAADRLEEVTHG